ncbi:Gfo/Idh/MocA family oxidoreductase [Candidatus Pelagibacter sp.]|nr:Gfo/Idh/MocA family oxidoreductase [Candidatus Pelagibacter sp.]
MQKLDLIIIGGGMFVSGQTIDDFGTILPSVLQAKKNNKINKITICCNSLKTAKKNLKKFNILKKLLNLKSNIEIFPKKKDDPECYLKIIKKDRFDCAIVSVPDHLHFRICKNVLKHKIHCLVVKPMVTKINHAKELIAISKKHRLIGQVEFHKRLDEANLIIRDKIKNNLIGNLQYINVNYSQKKIIPTNQFKKWSNKSNIFQYLGVHYVDLIYFITDAKPINVNAWGFRDYLKNKNINTWDSIHAVIEWRNKKNKFISLHSCNWIDPNKSSAMSDQKISFIGTKGRIDSDQKNRGLQIINDKNGINDVNPYFSYRFLSSSNRNYFSGYGIKSVNNFIKDVYKLKNNKINLKTLEKVRPSFKNSLISVSITDAINKSLKSNNKKIKINL